VSRPRAPLLGLLAGLLAALLSQAGLLLGDFITGGIDLRLHYRWAYQFVETLQDGHLYPRWSHRAYGGLGEPVFVYYSPLFQYLTAAVRPLVGDLWLAMKLVAFAAAWAGGFVSHLLLRRLGAGRWALPGAIAMAFTPMLVATLFRMHAFSWYAAWPLVVLSFHFMLDDRRDRILHLPLTLTIGLLVFTHTLSAFMVCLCGPLLVAREWPDWRAMGRTWLRWAPSMLLGLVLAAVYVLPAFTQQEHIHAENWFDEETINWRNSFALPAVTAAVYGVRWAMLQYAVAGSLLVGLVAATVYLVRRRGERDAVWRNILGLTAVGWVSLLLSTELAYPLYLWTPIKMVLRPTRFLEITGFMVVASCAVLATRWRAPAVLGAVCAAGLGAALLAQDLTEKQHHPPDRAVLADLFGQREYRTRHHGPGWEPYVERGGFAAECARKGVEMEETGDRSHDRRWKVAAREETALVLPLWFYPAWSVEVDGRPVEQRLHEPTGLIETTVPAGAHEVRVHWSGFAAERIGLFVTLGTATSLVLLALRRRNGRATSPDPHERRAQW